MTREIKLDISAYGQRDDKSNENISISLINLATEFHFSNGEADQNNLFTLITPIECSIAVKEVLIEWEDYQSEACCIVQCDEVNKQRGNELDINGSLILDESRPKVTKPLLRFVKKPGLKTSFIQIPDEKLIFHRLALKDLSSIYTANFEEIKQNIERYEQDIEDLRKEINDASTKISQLSSRIEGAMDWNNRIQMEKENGKPCEDKWCRPVLSNPKYRNMAISVIQKMKELLNLQKELEERQEKSQEELENFKRNSGISGSSGHEKILRKHDIVLHLRSLFDKNVILPIKYTHVVAEIHVSYPENPVTSEN